jgi:hypothetical protein
MALTTLTASCVTVVSAFQFGGQSGKKRKRLTVTINDPAATSGGITVGANTGDMPASVFGFTKIESCSCMQVYTTSGGAPVRLYLAAPDLAGTSVVTNVPSTATDTEAARAALTDVTIATTESAQITLVGY